LKFRLFTTDLKESSIMMHFLRKITYLEDLWVSDWGVQQLTLDGDIIISYLVLILT